MITARQMRLLKTYAREMLQIVKLDAGELDAAYSRAFNSTHQEDIDGARECFVDMLMAVADEPLVTTETRQPLD